MTNAGNPIANKAQLPELELSNAALMTRIGGGDREALTEMVRRHQERVWAIAYRCCRNRADADDIAQETFLRLWRAAAKYKPTAAFTTWLYRIVVNLCLDARRRARHRTAEEFLRQGLGLVSPPDPSSLERDETARRVQAAVDALPDRQRTALVLQRYESLSCRQIAEVTGWSESAVESLLVRAYATLRGALADLNGE